MEEAKKTPISTKKLKIDFCFFFAFLVLTVQFCYRVLVVTVLSAFFGVFSNKANFFDNLDKAERPKIVVCRLVNIHIKHIRLVNSTSTYADTITDHWAH